MLGLAALVTWCAFLAAWWNLWVLMEHPWPLYAGMAVTAALAAFAVRRGRWPGRALGAAAGLLAVATVVGLLWKTSYGSDRPTGPAVGATFPEVALLDARDGQPVDLRPPAGGFTFVVLFRGFW